MAEHLPECFALTHPDTVLDMCICDRLRAHGAAEYQRGRSDAAADSLVAVKEFVTLDGHYLDIEGAPTLLDIIRAVGETP